MSDNPTALFVIGSGRSGTTAVFDATVAAIDAAFLPRASRKSNLLAPLFIRAAGQAGLRKVVPALLSPCAESPYLYDMAGVRPADTVKRGRPMQMNDIPERWPSFASSVIRSTTRAFSSSVFVSKSTANSARVRALSMVGPNVKLLYVLRDPRAVALSLHKVDFWADMPLWWKGETVAEAVAGGASSLEIALQHWVNQNAAITDSLEDAGLNLDVHQVRYEAFCADPVPALRGIAEWAGARYNEKDLVAAAATVRPPTGATFDESLTQAARAIAGESASAFGYVL